MFGGDGPIPIAKVLREWRKKFKKLRLKGGVSEGEVLAAKEVDGLADLPEADLALRAASFALAFLSSSACFCSS